MADRGYLRQTFNGPDPAIQFAAIREAGVEHDDWVYQDLLPKGRKRKVSSTDPLPERAAVLRDLRPGSALVVYSLDRLGVSAGDIRAVLDELHDRGCVVRTVIKVTGDESEGSGSILTADTPRQLLSAACLAAEADLKRERMQKARSVRAVRAAAGVKGVTGGNQGWSPDPATKKAVKDAWLHDPTIKRREFKERYSVSAKVLTNHFGPRPTVPAGRPKQPSK